VRLSQKHSCTWVVQENRNAERAGLRTDRRDFSDQPRKRAGSMRWRLAARYASGCGRLGRPEISGAPPAMAVI